MIPTSFFPTDEIYNRVKPRKYCSFLLNAYKDCILVNGEFKQDPNSKCELMLKFMIEICPQYKMFL